MYIYIYIYIIHIYIHIYIHISYKTCPPGHCYNSFMATGALGHTHVRLHVVRFKDPKKAQVKNTATSICIYNTLEKNKNCR